MNLNEIQALIKFVSKSGVARVDIEIKDFKISIKTTDDRKVITQQVMAAPAPVYHAAPQASVNTNEVKSSPQSPAIGGATEEAKYITVKSPMIGTFYRSSSPDKPPFVNVGDDISNGKVLCIIEAMKLFNEIESDVSGKIVKVLVDDASPVEYDQPLFLVDPS
jgi:acetyl-CoA carboxylase biotin carboxyl carrier protein